MLSLLLADGVARAQTDDKRPPAVTSESGRFARFVSEAALRFGIPTSWITAVMRAESRGVVRAISPKGAMGLMQIMPDTGSGLRSRYGLGADPFDPHYNILAGAAYLRELHDRHGALGFLAAYNAGPGRYEDHLATGRPLPAETRAYVAALTPLLHDGGSAPGNFITAIIRSWIDAPLFPVRRSDGSTVPPRSSDGVSKQRPTQRRLPIGQALRRSPRACSRACQSVGPSHEPRSVSSGRGEQADTFACGCGGAETTNPRTAGVIGHDASPPGPKCDHRPIADEGKLSIAVADSRPPKRRRMTAMAHFAGLDVSIDETAVCVVDDQGAVLMQCSVPTEPESIAKALAPFAATLKRAGHEAGSLSPWLHPELKALGVPVVCLETRQVRAAMSAQRNKTDATDALGLAHLMLTGWFRQAYVKTDGAYRLKLLLTHRRNLKRKFLDLENAIRHSLKSFGVRLNKVGRGGFERAVREACAGDAFTAELMECMLTARAALWRQYLKLYKLAVGLVARDELCRRFMAIPGVGPVTAVTFSTAIHDPSRFRRSRDVAAYFGLTSKRWQSGASIDVQGRISKASDPDTSGARSTRPRAPC